ncbi:hypothetical protein [Acetobacterium bakii]|uniref:Uncharacterized protein n=1 Tax=Acetobacterium bakii TaxID=52689 RepID=A0A0L6U1H2_9FIRM|nr:hypothetical protein [Acetobacterium bakii]KNZ42344.1 hypothetical protein AKG39_06830 [Acetobacterium bakii]
MEHIINPEKQNIIFALLAAVLGIIVTIIPFVIVTVAAYQFYFAYFGIVIIVFALGFAFFYFRRYKQFDSFLEKKDEALIWKYEEEQYTAFIGELNKIQKTSSKKKVWILLGIELVIAVLLFILLSPEMKWLSVLFLAFFGIVSMMFTLYLPMSFKYKAMVKPYVTIISRDSAYIMGRFHKWTKAQAKIKNFDNGESTYKVLAINYEAMTRNGRLFQEWTAVIPEPENREMIASAKKWVDRINKQSRDHEIFQRDRISYSERLFNKVVGKKPDKKQ